MLRGSLWVKAEQKIGRNRKGPREQENRDNFGSQDKSKKNLVQSCLSETSRLANNRQVGFNRFLKF